MRKVVVTGLGFITSIGNNAEAVENSLRELRHGIERNESFVAQLKCPVSLSGTVKGFATESDDSEDWTYPSDYKIRRDQLRGYSPNVLYAHCALVQAIADAGLSDEEVSNEDTGMFTASAGSAVTMYQQMSRLHKLGVMRCSPLGVVSAVAGSLSFNLVAGFKIKGASTGFASACASSGHALGYAFDEIMLGRQKRMFVVGAEDGNLSSILPFASMRALSTSEDPDTASRPFDKNRNGFVGTGGGSVMVLEDMETAQARGAKIYAKIAGWGQASDGHNVAISHPEGAGLALAMRKASTAANIPLSSIDYINAHATSTPIGDTSEIRAIRSVFEANDGRPAISSTKALTGHGLSLASVMEAAFTVLGMAKGFTPGSAHISELDSEAEGLNILQETSGTAPTVALSNSSGFGGANVSLVFRQL